MCLYSCHAVIIFIKHVIIFKRVIQNQFHFYTCSYGNLVETTKFSPHKTSYWHVGSRTNFISHGPVLACSDPLKVSSYTCPNRLLMYFLNLLWRVSLFTVGTQYGIWFYKCHSWYMLLLHYFLLCTCLPRRFKTALEPFYTCQFGPVQ